MEYAGLILFYVYAILNHIQIYKNKYFQQGNSLNHNNDNLEKINLYETKTKALLEYGNIGKLNDHLLNIVNAKTEHWGFTYSAILMKCFM
jgi:hypothetical protein